MEKWKRQVSIGHRVYLPDAITAMDVSEFIHFYGASQFVTDWPMTTKVT